MFDVALSELLVIGVVALVVIGPERLPKVARTVGHLLGRMRRYVNDVKSDISREMQLEELKKIHSEVQDSARKLERSVSGGMQEVEEYADRTAQILARGISTQGPTSDSGAVAQSNAPATAGGATGAVSPDKKA